MRPSHIPWLCCPLEPTPSHPSIATTKLGPVLAFTVTINCRDLSPSLPECLSWDYSTGVLGRLLVCIGERNPVLFLVPSPQAPSFQLHDSCGFSCLTLAGGHPTVQKLWNHAGSHMLSNRNYLIAGKLYVHSSSSSLKILLGGWTLGMYPTWWAMVGLLSRRVEQFFPFAGKMALS